MIAYGSLMKNVRMRSQFAMMRRGLRYGTLMRGSRPGPMIAAYDITFGAVVLGETVKGKKAIAEWFRKWEKEVPRRKFEMKNAAFTALAY